MSSSRLMSTLGTGCLESNQVAVETMKQTVRHCDYEGFRHVYNVVIDCIVTDEDLHGWNVLLSVLSLLLLHECLPSIQVQTVSYHEPLQHYVSPWQLVFS